MMLQQALRPVQKSASRLLLAGANAAADFKDVPPEVQSTATVPGLAHTESGFTPAVPSRLPVFEYAQPAVAPLCVWRQDSLWPGTVQGWLGHAADPAADRPEPEPESPLAENAPLDCAPSAPSTPSNEVSSCGMQTPHFWQLNQRLPAGTMFCPVFFPVGTWAVGVTPDQAQSGMGDARTLNQQPQQAQQRRRRQQQQKQQPQLQALQGQQLLQLQPQPQPQAQPQSQPQPQPHLQLRQPSLHMTELSSAAPVALEGVAGGVQMPSRTAASRRQRRRQRTVVPASEVSQVGASHDVEALPRAQQGHDLPELDVPGMLWPSTPESTPPSSPRWSDPPSALFDQAVTWAYHPAAPVAGPHEVEGGDCDRLLKQLSEDVAVRPILLEQITGRMWTLASTQGGCRVVQKALEVAETSERVVLALQLQGHVREACTSPHANHVLQKCIELMPADRVQFVLEELKGHTLAAARHRYGCRVLERLIEHCSSFQTAELVDEVLAGAPQLCRHTFGNFVIQHILVHGIEEQRQKVAAVLCADIQRLARHRVASHVVRCALVHCSPEDRQRLALAMSADAGEFADLAHHHCGSFVVREMKRADGKRR
mmetsp:Transcript_15980/g.33279  ORF Transcript_15980/g.33279 Transcript_15980/m.33279 type:complete len:597 (-) Transcript_15980:453-2243(-)